MACLRRLEDGRPVAEYPLDGPCLRIGRAPDNDLVLEDKAVSSHHAQVEVVPGEPPEYHIEDLGSTNHTYVNGKAVNRQRLRHKDTIRLGLTFLEFLDPDSPDPERTTKLHKSWLPGIFYAKDD